MNEIITPTLDSLEDRLGDALGIALGIIRDPEAKALTNQTMATMEKAFLEWCDKQIDTFGDAPETVHPEDIGIILEPGDDD